MTSLEVIGAGLGRTSTASLQIALNQLGYKTAHMETVMLYNQFDDWIKAHSLDEETDLAEIERILAKVLKGFSASCDNPSCGFVVELMKMNPNAKVILTVRDTPEAWAKSASDTILRIIYESWFANATMAKSLIWFPILSRFIKLKILGRVSFERTAVGGFHTDIPENRVQHYEDWEEYVKANVPADKLLVFNAKQGWKPLCDFLGKPIPEGSYPRAPNTSANMKKMLVIKETVLRATFFGIYGGLAYMTYTGKTRQLLTALFDKAWSTVRDGNMTWLSL